MMLMRRESFLGSTGRWPVAFGSLPNALVVNSLVIIHSCSRQAAANHRLAACAPQKMA
jgi:hypothetical protein